jgi:hypothetical protein
MPAEAALVSLADKLHNARATCLDLRIHGPAFFETFTGKRDGTLWGTTAPLLTHFSSAIPGR